MKLFSFLILLVLTVAVTVEGSGIVQSAYSLIQDEGSSLARQSVLNFVGSGVSCVAAVGKTTCTISGGSGSGYATVQDDGTSLAQQSTINFIGTAVTCVDDPGNSRTNCTITGGGTSVDNYTQTFISQTSVSLTHNFGSRTTLTQCYDASNVLIIPNTVTLTTTNTTTVTFLVAQSGYCNVNGTGGGSSGSGGASSIAYSALPAASGTTGQLFTFTDSLYQAISNGSTYSYTYGTVPVTVPPSSGWTDLNIGTAVISSTGGYRNVLEGATNSGQIRGQYRALPSVPYDVKTAFLPHMLGNAAICGVGWYSTGDGRLTYIYPTSNMALQVQQWNSVSSVGTNYINAQAGSFAIQPMFVRLTDDGTDRKIYLSYNGLDWILILTVTRTDFHTPDSFFYGVASFSTTQEASGALIHYAQ